MTTEINKYGWTYKAKGDEENLEFEIITPDKIESPNLFQKLFSLSDNSVDSLLNQYIYATHPSQFNDIFDCYEKLLDFDDEAFVKDFLSEFAKERFTEEQIDYEIANNFKNMSTFSQRNFKEIIYGHFGVFSMTSNPYSLLMWSYYTNHQGYFIEYDISKFPFKFHGPFPLNYQENIEPISIKECGLRLGMLLQSNLKYKGWEHESEWRLIIESDEPMVRHSFQVLKDLGGHDRKFKYPIEAIKTVGFGNRFFTPEELVVDPKNGEILHVSLKVDIEKKSKVLDFLIANNINTCFAQRDGLIKIVYTGMTIEKTDDNKYVFDSGKWAAKQN